MNDSLRTNVFVQFSPEKIACACIYLAARKFQVLQQFWSYLCLVCPVYRSRCRLILAGG